jgi:GntR family transcriptional regulator
MVRDGARASQPRYTYVRDILFDRIQSGSLRTGEELDSHFDLGAKLGYRSDTVLKALEALCEEKVLARQAASNTFVVVQPTTVLFPFFQIYTDAGVQVHPDSRDTTMLVMPATVAEQVRLGLSNDARVLRIKRVRTDGGRAFITERIVLPQEMFPELEWTRPLPNRLYDILERQFSVTVARVEEQIGVVGATARDAKSLNVPLGTPLLTIDRTAFSSNDEIVEWRVSHVHLARCHYRSRTR